MKRAAWIAWLRLCAFVLDRLGRKHAIRRRLGQLTRRKPEALEVQS